MRTFDIALDGREALQLSAALWIGAGLFVGTGAILAGNIRYFGEYLTLLTGLLSALVIAWGMFLVMRALAGRPRWRAYVVLPLTVAGAAVAQSLIDYAWFHVVNLALPTTRLPAIDAIGWLVVGFTNMCLFAANLALMWVTSANRALRLNSIQLAKAEADYLRSELQVLRLKLDPHFLFNALNAATQLVAAKQPDRAEAMLAGLSNVLRSTFDVGVEDIPLRDELSIVSEYLSVEAVRFPERLRVRIECDPAVESVSVPSFLLQPIVENAVKYGVARADQPVTISIVAAVDGPHLRLCIENDGPASGAIYPGTGVGLAATRSRVLMRYGGEGRFHEGPIEGGFRVEIRLPLPRADVAPVPEKGSAEGALRIASGARREEQGIGRALVSAEGR